MRFWIAWWEEIGSAAPLEARPNTRALVGWWRCATDGERQTIAAVVDAPYVGAAQKMIIRAGRPVQSWRWCEAKDPAWMPDERLQRGEAIAPWVEVQVRGVPGVDRVAVRIDAVAEAGDVTAGLLAEVRGGPLGGHVMVLDWEGFASAYREASRWRDINAQTPAQIERVTVCRHGFAGGCPEDKAATP